MARSKYGVRYFLTDTIDLRYNGWFIIIERGTQKNEKKANTNNNNLRGCYWYSTGYRIY